MNESDKTNRNISVVLFIFWLLSTSFDHRSLSIVRSYVFWENLFLESFLSSFVWYPVIDLTWHIHLLNENYFLLSKCLQLTFIYLQSRHLALSFPYITKIYKLIFYKSKFHINMIVRLNLRKKTVWKN